MTFMSMLKVTALAIPLALAHAAGAAPLIGSIVIGSASVSVSGSLANLNLLAPISATAGLSTGSFSAAGNWSGSVMTVSASALQTSSPVNLTVSAAGFGTFTASAYRVVQESTDTLDVMFVGAFDPQFSAGAFSNGQAATLRLEVNRTGTVANLTGILALAVTDTGSGISAGTGETADGGFTGGGSTGGEGAAAIPEPAALALLGTGLAGMGLLRRRWAC